jgi:hypothetical protein
MAVNPNIALSFRAPQIESPINMLAQAQQIQGQQQLNQMREMEMRNAQEDRAQSNALAQFMRGFQPGVTDSRQALQFGRPGAAVFQQLTAADKARAEAEAKAAEQRRKQQERLPGALGRALLIARADPSDAGLNTSFGLLDAEGIDTAPFRQQFAQMTPEQRLAAIEQYVTTNPEGRAALTRVRPNFVERNAGNRKFYEDTNPDSPTFGQQRSEMQLAATPDNMATNARIAAEGAANRAVQVRGQNMTDARARATSGIESVRNLQLALQNDPEHQQRLAEARAAGTAAGKDVVAARATLPSAISQGQRMLEHIDAMVGKAPGPDGRGGTRPHPGFSGAVGLRIPGVALVPGTEPANFVARLGEVQGGAFLQAFETLKGGGAITEKEGEKATQAITRMSTAQSEAEFITAAREFQQVVRDGVRNAERRLQQAGARPAAGGAAPAAPAATARSPQDAQALQWANANPADPRAAAIKQRLGVQ